jgi:hypothetical protein
VIRWAIVAVILFSANALAAAQIFSSEQGSELSQSRYTPSDTSRPAHSSSLLTPLQSQTLEGAYHPITPSQTLRWFVSSTVGPQHLAVGVFSSALGTALDRPKEYGPHWGGFADRFGIGMSGTVTGNAIEASAGLMLREDPRYFRVPERRFKNRIGNVAQLTFTARDYNGRFGPAYARYAAIVGSNFLSNTWREHSEANAQDALLRTSEGFAGRMASNAFSEFWPDIKKLILRKHN